MQFGGQHHAVPKAVNRFADKPFVVAAVFRQQVRAVAFCRIKKGAAEIMGFADRLNTIGAVRDLSVTMAKSHTTHADGRDLNIP